MLRRLLRTLTIALLCGFVIFVILFVAAWYDLRKYRDFSSRQGSTRHLMRGVELLIEKYQKEHGSLPQKLTDLPDANQIWSTPDGIPADAWDRAFQYHPRETSYELFSFGSDGKVGGIGLNADLYLDERNRKKSMVTFSQYLLSSDDSEARRNTFLHVGTMAGGFVALYIFCVLWTLERADDRMTPRHLILFAGAIVLISSAIGLFLLPVHLSSGH
ncbi:type II secretion system protein GspG [Gimesia fumaroli]|uniref:Bacterial type II secretion system protein G n=1 Tax=Gimesia fumaroli TaxID=2527976 RepID=A0A518IBA1_9PLAN|nr:type II secretion system protein GspG [Gimesia fumaroli]QDV50319.1 Bacterial type II secretion system protein G [Gimesia fumaroli]